MVVAVLVATVGQVRVLVAACPGRLVVAGGQGSRLGFDGPKGAYPVGPITQRSLFAIQAQKLRALGRRTGHAMRWFVLTSPAAAGAPRAAGPGGASRKPTRP